MRFVRLKMHPRQYGFLRFFRLKKPAREFTQGSRHFCAFQQDSAQKNLLHVFVYHRFVRHPIIHCLSLLDCTYTVIRLRTTDRDINNKSLRTALYIHARQFFHTHNRKIKTTNKQINNNAHLQFEFYRLECSS